MTRLCYVASSVGAEFSEAQARGRPLAHGAANRPDPRGGSSALAGARRYREQGTGNREQEEVSRLVGKKRIDWAAIQAEYIGGNIGQARLAKKHRLAYGSLRRRAEAEGWYELKKAAVHECGVKAAQKTADAAAENAVVAARIRAKLLARLETLADATLEATEEREYDLDGNLTQIHRLRDLTSALKDLTGDLPKGEAGRDIEDLGPLAELLGG